MNQIYKLISIISFIGIISSCGKSCPDYGTKTSYVDKSYLSEIIPYSDTSTRLFLKNGKDSLQFKSQGLKEIFISDSSLGNGDCPYNYKNQQLSLKMMASDTDLFEIYYNSINDIQLSINQTKFEKLFWVKENIYDQNKSLTSVFVNEVTILNNSYTSVTKIASNNLSNYFIYKGNLGAIKIVVNQNTYELIK
jgi:hypothetical protein